MIRRERINTLPLGTEYHAFAVVGLVEWSKGYSTALYVQTPGQRASPPPKFARVDRGRLHDLKVPPPPPGRNFPHGKQSWGFHRKLLLVGLVTA